MLANRDAGCGCNTIGNFLLANKCGFGNGYSRVGNDSSGEGMVMILEFVVVYRQPRRSAG